MEKIDSTVQIRKTNLLRYVNVSNSFANGNKLI